MFYLKNYEEFWKFVKMSTKKEKRPLTLFPAPAPWNSVAPSCREPPSPLEEVVRVPMVWHLLVGRLGGGKRKSSY